MQQHRPDQFVVLGNCHEAESFPFPLSEREIDGDIKQRFFSGAGDFISISDLVRGPHGMAWSCACANLEVQLYLLITVIPSTQGQGTVKRRTDLPQSTESGRGETEDGVEHTGEVKGIAEPGLIGHLLDHHAGLLEALGGVVHFQAEQILVW